MTPLLCACAVVITLETQKCRKRPGAPRSVEFNFFINCDRIPVYYRKRGSASYIVREVLSVRERERDIQRERERDGSDVTIFALKLAMNLHFPLPKIRTIGDELTLSLAKNSHFSFLPSHFPALPSRRGPEVTIVALKFAMSSHLRPSGGDIPVPVRSPKSSTVERG